MAKPLAVESNISDHKVGISDRQALLAFAERLNERARQIGKNPTEIGRMAGITKQSMQGYAAGSRFPGTDKLFALADALGVDGRWLVTGERSRPIDANEADWIDVPEYDLREVGETSFGQSLASTPVRRDWLYSITRASTGLWLTRLISDYQPAGLAEGDLTICRSIRREELAEGHVCLWRIQDTVVVGRFSVVPDVAMVQGRAVDPRYIGAYLDHSLGVATQDLLVPPSAIGEDGRYHPIGRILGVMVRPI